VSTPVTSVIEHTPKGEDQKGGKVLWLSCTRVPRINTGTSTTTPSLGFIGNAGQGLSEPRIYKF
jgi:hypothetical protein